MKSLTQLKNLSADAAAYLFVLLFVYAAVSKLIEFEDFQIQLAQSPLLSAYAGLVAPVIIAIELITVIFLSFRVTRLVGLYLSFSLMAAFTIYISLILNYSEFIPCSCGGILEDMGWTEHLVFNIGFILLGGWALWIMENRRTKGFRRILTRGIVSFVFSTGIVIGLFFSSEHIIKKENPFVRRFIPHAITLEKYYDLKFNSYYFAGYDNGQIYLGNYTAPLVLTVTDTAFIKERSTKIEPDYSSYNFRFIEIKVKPPYYYIYDGSVPVLYRGNLNESTAKTLSFNDAFFTQLEIADSARFVINTQSAKTKSRIIGALKVGDSSDVRLNYDLLSKQSDGIFDTDGILLGDRAEGKNEFVYVYYYRNEIPVFDGDLKFLRKLKTIDTISRAQVKVKRLSNGNIKMEAPPLRVNERAILYKGILFNQSNLMGKHESKEIWDKAVVIDIYNINEKIYLGSFFIETRGKEKMTHMLVTDTHFYVLSGTEILGYRLAPSVMQYFKQGEAENP
ncbi:MAG: MauE/DoxX family redox-associated membrane protein [Weeksellaceae bacterium]